MATENEIIYYALLSANNDSDAMNPLGEKLSQEEFFNRTAPLFQLLTGRKCSAAQVTYHIKFKPGKELSGRTRRQAFAQPSAAPASPPPASHPYIPGAPRGVRQGAKGCDATGVCHGGG